MWIRQEPLNGPAHIYCIHLNSLHIIQALCIPDKITLNRSHHSACQQGNAERIGSIVDKLVKDYAFSAQANYRKGGLLCLAATAVALAEQNQVCHCRTALSGRACKCKEPNQHIMQHTALTYMQMLTASMRSLHASRVVLTLHHPLSAAERACTHMHLEGFPPLAIVCMRGGVYLLLPIRSTSP